MNLYNIIVDDFQKEIILTALLCVGCECKQKQARDNYMTTYGDLKEAFKQQERR